MRVVVVEDEPVIREAVVEMLRLTGHDVVEAGDGVEGLGCATAQDVDLVLLDLMLPRKDGFEVLAELRTLRPSLPVIILTAKGSEEDVVRGLRGGADDYVVKPFGARELLARIDAVIRRSPARPEQVSRVELGDFCVDFARRELQGHGLEGGHTSLTEAEAAILSYLVENPGRAVSREEILGRLWGVFGSRSSSRTVDMHVARLRAKLSDDGSQPRLILTVRGKGYMLGGAG
jgi:two-component system, OmpR family, response regulator RpaB